MRKMSPTTRSRQLLQAEGFTVATVEKRLPRCFVSVDLFGFADLLAIRAGDPGPVAVQVTTTDNQAARLAKIRATPEAATWLACNGRIELHGWRKSKKSGRWQVTRRPIVAADLEPPDAASRVAAGERSSVGAASGSA